MGDSKQVQVKTRIPPWQKEQWQEHADQLGMSQSEFIRTMVQAGRRELGLGEEDGTIEEGDAAGSNPRGRDLEVRVEAALSQQGPLGWDELVETVVDNVEQQVEDALDELQSSNQVRYSGRNGGYEIVDEP